MAKLLHAALVGRDLDLDVGHVHTTVRRAMTQLALRYRPDKGGTLGQMVRVNAAYEAAKQAIDPAAG